MQLRGLHDAFRRNFEMQLPSRSLSLNKLIRRGSGIDLRRRAAQPGNSAVSVKEKFGEDFGVAETQEKCRTRKLRSESSAFKDCRKTSRRIRFRRTASPVVLAGLLIATRFCRCRTRLGRGPRSAITGGDGRLNLVLIPSHCSGCGAGFSAAGGVSCGLGSLFLPRLFLPQPFQLRLQPCFLCFFVQGGCLLILRRGFVVSVVSHLDVNQSAEARA